MRFSQNPPPVSTLHFGALQSDTAKVFKRGAQDPHPYFFRDSAYGVTAQGENTLLGRYDVYAVFSKPGPGAENEPIVARFVGEKGNIGVETWGDNSHCDPFNPFRKSGEYDQAVQAFTRLFGQYDSEARSYDMAHPVNQQNQLFQELFQDTLQLKQAVASQSQP